MAENELRGLPPVVDGRSRVLVLGSFPSVKSLAAGAYYGNPLNQFWTLAALAFGVDPPAAPPGPARHAWALERGLAIWDVLAACVRPGSLDRDIRDPRPNDVAGLLAAWPAIARVALNGAGAAGYFERFVRPALARPIDVRVLPSSSPIPSRRYRGPADKLPAWRAALADPIG